MEMICQVCSVHVSFHQVPRDTTVGICQACRRMLRQTPGGSAFKHPITKTIVLKVKKLPPPKTAWQRLLDDHAV